MLYFVSLLLVVSVSVSVADNYRKVKVESGKGWAIENRGFPGPSVAAPLNGWHFTSDAPIKMACHIFEMPVTPNCGPLIFIVGDNESSHRRSGSIPFTVTSGTNELRVVYYHPPGRNKGGRFRCEIKRVEEQKPCSSPAKACTKKTCTRKEYLDDIASGKNLCGKA